MEDLEEYYDTLQKPFVIDVHKNEIMNEKNSENVVESMNGGNVEPMNEVMNEKNSENVVEPKNSENVIEPMNKTAKKTHNRSKSIAITKHYKLRDYLN